MSILLNYSRTQSDDYTFIVEKGEILWIEIS